MKSTIAWTCIKLTV